MVKIDEQKRITEVYQKREEQINGWRYSVLNPTHFYISQSRDREFFVALKKNGIKSFQDLKILDIGCGKGDFLNFLVSVGFNPVNCFGVDIIKERIRIAKKRNPAINLRCLDAQKLPFKKQSFDIVIQQTTFTSILDSKIKQNIAKEMARVIKLNGTIIWYDFFINNPKNRNTRAIRKKEIRHLFPKFQITLKKITLAPPLTRFFINQSYFLVYLFEKTRILNTHYFGIIKNL